MEKRKGAVNQSRPEFNHPQPRVGGSGANAEAKIVSEPLPVVYLARLGETAWSLISQHTGGTDRPLTSTTTIPQFHPRPSETTSEPYRNLPI